ncbi:inhibitor of nuclear factor kappa-B kinase subunit beta [Lucilia sericata]|uniref:inhibitor of nuclear factor kappa-B kinase subunit beta n=1 Tax=Lucilia sericata TaxID=13632 RepID=UPI0018A838EB|nr:inhibitor of nuclear factor kappa-B kinase subunit beta [Lucilia sericata]
MNRQPLQSFGNWQLVKTLGEGAFGEVHLWKHNQTGKEFATKRLKANPKLNADEISIMHKRWHQEYRWMQNLQTPHIVRSANINDEEFFRYLAGGNHVEHSLPVIIMEYCNGGDLRRQLNQVENVNGLKEFEIRTILNALLCAIDYLHQVYNIEHRDIKPENIILHIEGNKKIYKLTDFGYAREIPESTVAQSVVGTRNYVAPEVIDPGDYTETVDYWSIGIVAYEIICGHQPFLPHQTFFNRMTNIKRKTRECIAIAEDVDHPDTENFIFIKHLPAQNHSSTIFIKKMEDWLRLTLDIDYKTRGRNSKNELKFYTDMRSLLNKKIVTVFSLKSYEKFYYDIEAYSSLENFLQHISYDTQIDINNIFAINPPLHPCKNILNPLDYYVPEWSDISNPLNPPVMLFVGEFLIQSELNINEEKHFLISDTIKSCVNINPQEGNIPVWLLQQFEKDVHFMLTKEQHYLVCYLMGLENYVIEIEHNVFKYKDEINKLIKKTSELVGSVKYSNIFLNEFLNIQNGQIANSTIDMAQKINTQCQDFEANIVPMLSRLYTEILQTFRDLANNTIYKEVREQDIFELLKYRKYLNYEYPLNQRLENAQCAFDKCIHEFISFTKSSKWKETREKINKNLQLYNNLRQQVNNVFNEMIRLENELHEYTRSVVRHTMNNTRSTSSMIALDGTNEQYSLSAFDSETPELINDCQSIINAMQSSMYIDE